MMYNTLIIPRIDYDVSISPEGSVALLSEDGLDTLFIMIYRKGNPDQIVVNDHIAGTWGSELIFSEPSTENPGRAVLHFEFNGTGMDIWDGLSFVTFPRFDSARRVRARFVRLLNADNPGGSLISRIGSLDANLARIENRILSRRLEALERRLSDKDGRPPNAG